MTGEIELLQQQLEGLSARLRTLQDAKLAFTRANTLDREISGLQTAIAESESGLEILKSAISELIQARNESLSETTTAIAGAMGEILPGGKAHIVITEEGQLSIGWYVNGATIPYHALSGGQKVIFDAALCAAMLKKTDNGVVIMEAAEMDSERLKKSLVHMAKTNPGVQIICNSWHCPGGLPEEWSVVEIK